jgi:hypothetical protein
MARTFETVTVDEMQETGASLIEKEGKYHLFIEIVEDGKIVGTDTEIDGFGVKASCLAGPDEMKKTINMVFRDGNLSDKDGGKMARKIQSAFFIASNILTPQQLTGGSVEIDEQIAVGQQVIAHLKFGKEKDGKRYLQLAWDEIYHVDDPRAKDVAKNADALSAIDAKFRRTADYFAPLIKAVKPAAATPAASATQPDFGGL